MLLALTSGTMLGDTHKFRDHVSTKAIQFFDNINRKRRLKKMKRYGSIITEVLSFGFEPEDGFRYKFNPLELASK